jgi:UDP-N-acetylmuramate: L-alanyl-gamma-D-glutamyl-meso-diaminopimelate ligase
MHNLALALHRRGAHVTGPTTKYSSPRAAVWPPPACCPPRKGGTPPASAPPSRRNRGHARPPRQPELLRAQELGLKIYSFPEYIYEASRDKQRIVIGGSHGKTSITACILHVLRYHNRKFDYAVGAQLAGST